MIYRNDFEKIANGLPIRESADFDTFRVTSDNSDKMYNIPLAHFYAPCAVNPVNDDQMIATGLVPVKRLRKAIDGSARAINTYIAFSGFCDGNASFKVNIYGSSGPIASANSPAPFTGAATVAILLSSVADQDVLYIDLMLGKGKGYTGAAYLTSMVLYAVVQGYGVRQDFMAVNSTYSQDKLNTMLFLAEDLKSLGISRASMMFMAESPFLKKHDGGATCGFPHRLASTVPVKDGPYCVVTKPHEQYVDVTIRYKAELIAISADGSLDGRPTLCVVAAHETPGSTVSREITPVSSMQHVRTFRIPANRGGPTWFYIQFCSGGHFAADTEQEDEQVPNYGAERDYLAFYDSPAVEALFEESSTFKFCVSKALGIGESASFSEFVRVDDIAGAWKKVVAAKTKIVVLKEPEGQQTFGQRSFVVDIGYIDILGVCAAGVYEPKSRNFPAMVPASATIHKGLVRGLVAGYEACLQQQAVMRQPPFQGAGTLATRANATHTYGPWCPAMQMCNDLVTVPAYPSFGIFWDRATASGHGLTKGRAATVLGVPVMPMVSSVQYGAGVLYSPGVNIKIYYASYLPRKDDNAPIRHKWLFMMVKAADIRLYMSRDYAGVAPPMVLGSVTEEFDKSEYANKHSKRLTRYMDTLSPDLWNLSPLYTRDKSQMTKQFFYQDDLERESGAVVRESATLFVSNEELVAADGALGAGPKFLVVENVMGDMDQLDGDGELVGMPGRGFYDSHAIVVGFAAWHAPAVWKLEGTY